MYILKIKELFITLKSILQIFYGFWKFAYVTPAFFKFRVEQIPWKAT